MSCSIYLIDLERHSIQVIMRKATRILDLIMFHISCSELGQWSKVCLTMTRMLVLLYNVYSFRCGLQ